MPLYNKPLESVTEDDLQALKDTHEAESKIIEYKSQLPDGTSSSKKNLLEGVSSFANTIGGDLIFGIKAENGIPVEITGLELSNLDGTILSLENMIRDGIRPRIRFGVYPIKLENKRTVLIIRVNRGLAPPHQITFDKDFRFYARNSNGKYRLDVDELRTIFDLSGTIAERIRNFRAERLSNILAEETPVPLENVAKVVLHLIPLRSFSTPLPINLDLNNEQRGRFRPIKYGAGNYRYNLDGLLRYDNIREERADGYIQLFRNGIIEAVDAYILGRSNAGKPFIPSTAFERQLIEVLPGYLSILEELNIELPSLLMLSLLGVRGFFLAVDERLFTLENQTVDRDHLLIPEVPLESYQSDPNDILRPIFDSIWNATGWPRSMNYNEEGKRVR